MGSSSGRESEALRRSLVCVLVCSEVIATNFAASEIRRNQPVLHGLRPLNHSSQILLIPGEGMLEKYQALWGAGDDIVA